MKPLTGLDIHHLREAEGWLMLSNSREANEALDRLSPANGLHPDALHLRWHICAHEKQWGVCAEVGRALCEAQPESVQGWINYANALFYLKRFQEAIDVTLPILERFPSNPYIRYNMACYECQKGHHDDAIKWFTKALDLGNRKEIQEMALADPDLEPLRARIVQI